MSKDHNEQAKTLKAALKAIENQGDRDEASYKHVLHGLTALCHLGSWREGKDYKSPGYGMNEKIESYWNIVVSILEDVGREKFGDLVECTDYTCNYRMDLYVQG